MAGIGECSICTEPLDNNLATIPCGHIFHIECVKKCIQSSEFKDLFIQLNKVAETNNQSLKRVLSQLQQKEKECEALKKELLEEKTLREATEHALALEKSKNKTVLTPPKTMSHEREVLKKPELPPKPIKIQQNPSSTNGISKQANEKNLQRFSPLPTRLNVVRPIVRPTVRKFVRPNVIYVHRSTSPLIIEPDFPVIITYLGGSSVCIEINDVIIVAHPTKALLPKLLMFKKISICIGASPDKNFIIQLMHRFPDLIFLTSEKKLLQSFPSRNLGRIYLIEHGTSYTYLHLSSPIDFIPSIGWIIKCHFCNIYLYCFTIDLTLLKKNSSFYGNFDIIITKPVGIAKNIVHNHVESKSAKTILLGGISSVVKAELYNEIDKVASNFNDFVILNELEEFIYQKSCVPKKIVFLRHRHHQKNYITVVFRL